MTYALNYLLYQAGWFTCVLGAAGGRPWLAALAGAVLLAVHLGLARRRADELALALAVMAIGLAVDALQIRLGTLRFSGGLLDPRLPPPWLVILWAQFATTLHFCLAWVRHSWWRSVPFGAIGGPCAFLAGARLGAVQLASPVWPSLLSLSVLWSVAMPLAATLAARQALRPGAGEYRWPGSRRG